MAGGYPEPGAGGTNRPNASGGRRRRVPGPISPGRGRGPARGYAERVTYRNIHPRQFRAVRQFVQPHNKSDRSRNCPLWMPGRDLGLPERTRSRAGRSTQVCARSHRWRWPERAFLSADPAAVVPAAPVARRPSGMHEAPARASDHLAGKAVTGHGLRASIVIWGHSTICGRDVILYPVTPSTHRTEVELTNFLLFP